MQGNRHEIGPPPLYINCNSLSRAFPPEWKDVWFRRQARLDESGVISYMCPLCSRKFDHTMIGFLQGDHVWPYSLFGETSWANYQLICGGCNASKSNRIEIDIRLVLGNGEFRSMVVAFLRDRMFPAKLKDDAILSKILDFESGIGELASPIVMGAQETG